MEEESAVSEEDTPEDEEVSAPSAAGETVEVGTGSPQETGEMDNLPSQKDHEIAALKEQISGLEARLLKMGNSLAEAVAGYRAAILEQNPEITPDLVTGDDIGSIKESLSRARELVGRVRREMEGEIARARVPSGAPERGEPDLSGLSAREKIILGISPKY